LAEGRSRLEHYASGADCHSTLACLRALGLDIEEANESIVIAGTGLRGLRSPDKLLDAGNSGSTIRMLSGILAAQPFASSIGGDASLSRRPMKRIIEPLTLMGARISSADGRPPLAFAPPTDGHLKSIEYRLPIASAQVKSAILLAGLFANGSTIVEEPAPTRDHTELALRNFGVEVHRRRGRIEVRPPAKPLAPQQFRVPGDPSSAAFFLCAAALFPDASVIVEEVSLNPTRAALLDVLRRMGVHLELVALEERGGEVVGSIKVGGNVTVGTSRYSPQQARLRRTRISGAESVALIDEIPVLSVLATAVEGGIEFRDVAELRVKESDRITAIAQNLRAMGAHCEERPDGLVVPGPQQLHGAEIQTFSDHRIAMAFSVAALIARGESIIDDPACVSISFPEFYTLLDQIVQR
jgi:3-phosphoshikimate 1-carboxyvinyltransferase